jgi:ABC-type polysaccharide/polyol phosphate transport system ATPase subunit
LWLDHGEVVQVGAPEEVLNAYSGTPAERV